MRQVRLGDTAPGAPAYVYHAVLDEGIPYAQAAQLRHDWCAQGGDVTFHADYTNDHITLGAAGAPAAIAFLSDRFAGRPTRPTC